jgi:hypothetical protein
MKFDSLPSYFVFISCFDILQRLEKEALELAEMATTKQFLDPTQNPTKILIEMRRVCTQSSIFVVNGQELSSLIAEFNDE